MNSNMENIAVQKTIMTHWTTDNFRLVVLNKNVQTVAVEFTGGKYKGFVFTTKSIGLQRLTEGSENGIEDYELHLHYQIVNQKGLYEVNAFDRAIRECIWQYVKSYIAESDAQERNANT